MCGAERARAIAAAHTLFAEGIRPGPNWPARMNQDAGGGGLMEPSTDAPADTDLASMPAGFGWTAPFGAML